MAWCIVRTVLAIQLLLVFLSGCTVTRYYVADSDAVPVTQGQVSPLVVSGGVKLVNAQSDNTDQVMVKTNLYTVFEHYTMLCSYQQITDEAIDIARQALGIQGITVADNSIKTLRLAVVDVERPSGVRVARTAIELQVEYGDDERALFKEVSYSSDDIYRSYNRAVMKAVVAMLNDTGIRAYLEE